MSRLSLSPRLGASLSLIALTALLVACADPGGGGDPSAVVIEYEGGTVTLADFESELARRDFDGGADRDSALLAFADALADKIVMAADATRYPRGDTTGLGAELSRLRDETVLARLRDRELSGVGIDDGDLDRIYDWLGEEVHAFHILLPTKERADSVRAVLEKGADFGEVAAEVSTDLFSARRGGEIGWIRYGDYVGLDEATFPLEPGEIGGPAWTRRGWHVVTVRDRRAAKRAGVDEDLDEFRERYDQRLKDHRWLQYVERIWAEYDIRWNDPGVEIALAQHVAFRNGYDAKSREAQRIMEAGGELDSTFRDYPRGPEPGEEGTTPVAVSQTHPSFVYTVYDAADAVWATNYRDLPKPLDKRLFEKWLRSHVGLTLARFDSRESGFATSPETKRAVENAVEFRLVERLYRREVEQRTIPSEVQVEEYYEANRDHFIWRPDIDITIVQAADILVATRIKEALEQGESGKGIEMRFGGTPGLAVTRSGPKREFPSIEGLSDLARSLDDRVGQVSEVRNLEGRATVVRVEAVGEPVPMTFHEAFSYAYPAVAATMREARTRALLDSLRVTYDISIDSALVLRARPEKTS